MAATPEGEIPNLLMARLAALTLSPALPVAWEGRDYTPPAGTYLSARYLPNTNQEPFVGNTDPARHLGIFQVTVNVLPDGGIIAPSDIAGAIVDHFAKGTKLSANGVTVHVYEKPSVGSALQDPERIRVPVSIRYQSFNA